MIEENKANNKPQLLSLDEKSLELIRQGKLPIAPIIITAFFLVMTLMNIVSFYTHTPPVERAILWGDIDRLEQIIKGGLDLNNTRIDDNSLLAMTLAYMDHSANPLRNLGEKEREEECRRRNRVRIAMMEALIEGGADINLLDDNGLAVLHYCIHTPTLRGYKLEFVKMLLAKGADPNLKNKAVDSVKFGSGWISSLDKNERGGTALHLAVSGNEYEIVEILLKNGADVDIVNKLSQTPLDVAIDKEWPDIATLLRDAAVIKIED